jgi:hypothetical protein
MNRGMKFAKDGKTIASTDPDDYNFWTDYPPLNFLEKKTVNITATSSTCSGTEVVSHDYDFIPMVLGTVKKDGGKRYYMPADDFDDINCDFGLIPVLSFDYSIFSNKVEIYWTADCVLMGDSYCVLSDQDFTCELYFYLWELGKQFPFS